MTNRQLRQTFKFYINNSNKEQLNRKVNDLAKEVKNNKNVKSDVYAALVVNSFKQCYKIVVKNNYLAKDDTIIVSVFEEALVEAIEKWDENRSQFITFLYIHFQRMVNNQIVAQRRIWKRKETLKQNDYFQNNFSGFTLDKIGMKSLVNTLKITKQEKQVLWYSYLGYSFNEISKKLNISNWKYYKIINGLQNQLNILDFV